ncbi:MAG: AAA family ATPase [Leptolyngbya sp. IPPAS B-1204]
MLEEQEQTCLYLMCGLPCSGKTTFASQLAKEKNALVFSLDKLVLSFFPEEDNFETHRKYVQRVQDAFFPIVSDLLWHGCSIVMDFPAHTRNERDQLRQLAIQAKVKTQLYYLQADLRRFAQRFCTIVRVVTWIVMKPYSLDLREKIISTYEAGNTSIRQVAARFQVSKNTVQSLLKRKQATGTLKPAPATGGKTSQLAGFEQEIAEMVEQHQDYTLAEYCESWQEKTGVRVSESTMCRFLQKQQLTVKKNISQRLAAAADKQTQRVAYWQTISTVEPENLVFLDEMGVLQGMSRPREEA